MSRSSLQLLLLFALLAPAPLRALSPSGAPDNPFFDRKTKPKEYDQNELRSQVEETQSLLDALARESRRVDKKTKEDLIETLKTDFALADERSSARKSLERAETVIDIQAAIKSQQAILSASLDLSGTAEADKQEKKLLRLQGDLVSAVDDLRKGLSSQQKDFNESATRDFRNWIMVSEGILRNRREDAEAAQAAQGPPPETVVAAPAGISPPAEAQALSPAAQAVPPATLSPTAKARGTKAAAARPLSPTAKVPAPADKP